MRRRKGDAVGADFTAVRRVSNGRRSPRRILLIEPSRVDRLLVNTALVLKGRDETRLTEVTDLDLGLSLLLQRPYDLVMLADRAANQSPWETTRAIRAVAPTTPIIRHAPYLAEPAGNDNGLDQLVEAVETALAEALAKAS